MLNPGLRRAERMSGGQSELLAGFLTIVVQLMAISVQLLSTITQHAADVVQLFTIVVQHFMKT